MGTLTDKASTSNQISKIKGRTQHITNQLKWISSRMDIKQRIMNDQHIVEKDLGLNYAELMEIIEGRMKKSRAKLKKKQFEDQMPLINLKKLD